MRMLRGHCFKRGVFPKTASFKSYGVKHERKSQYANKFKLTADGIALFRDQRTATTSWVTGEAIVASQAGYRG